eukprot:scaffold1301_cov191-Pinguiococcus_pyrenoidosus.AAC.1
MCEEPDSQPNRNENRCYFDEDEFSCRPTEPDPSAIGVVVAAAFALLFMGPIAVFFDWFVNKFLSDPPPEYSDLLGALKAARRARMAETHGERADCYFKEELHELKDRPFLQPLTFQSMWPRWLADGILAMRVHRAAQDAARMETEFDAETMAWWSLDGMTAEDYVAKSEEVVRRKMLLTGVAVRDSLPWAKSLVFRNYTNFGLAGGSRSKLVRQLAMAAMLAFNLFCIVYLMAFGANITYDESVGWLVSFLLGEVVVIFILTAFRVIVLNVVLPSLIRFDVTVDRACLKIPHYSAACMLARKRDDLVPGLRSVFDARFRTLQARMSSMLSSSSRPRDEERGASPNLSFRK